MDIKEKIENDVKEICKNLIYLSSNSLNLKTYLKIKEIQYSNELMNTLNQIINESTLSFEKLRKLNKIL